MVSFTERGFEKSDVKAEKHIEVDSDVEKLSLGNSVDPTHTVIEIDETNFDFIHGDPTFMTNSPYPEVRAAVSVEVDPNVHLNHWRSWFMVTVFVIVFAGVNQFFSLRYPSISISYVVAQIISFPIGKALAKLPDIRFKHAPFFNLNPAPFGIQEHALLTIIVSLTASSAYAMNILIATTNFYHIDVSVGYQILLVLTSQMLGYSAAQLSQRWVVYPAAAIWPLALVTATIFTTLAKADIVDAVKVARFNWSRFKMFYIVTIGSFVWYWVPDFLFKGLSNFNWICWIAPNNTVVNQIFGTSSGLAVGIPITFDWTQITQALSVSPLATPFNVAANTYGSVFIFFWIVLPILYYTNTWYAKYMPMISSTSFDNTQKSYNVTRILNKHKKVDKALYKAYSPVFVSYSYLLSYALNFAAVTSLITHSILYNGKTILGLLKDPSHTGDDIHRRLMKKHFKDVPYWWSGVLFLVAIGFGFGAVCGWPEYSQTPWYGLILAIAIALSTFLFEAILQSTTNQHVGLNIITELVAGYVFKGNPFANMIIKLVGFIPNRQGLNFAMDLKLGQYMKIPPRTLFMFQVYGTVLASLVNVGVQQWMRFNIKDICVPGTEFSCASGRVIFTASITFSLVEELFSPGKIYNPLLYFFLIGAIFPFFTYYLWKKYPTRWFGRINSPVFFTGPGNIPPSTLYNYSLYFATCFVFNFYLKRFKTAFHTRYNNVISAGFDAGVAIAGVIIFLCVSYPGGKLTWWGNTVYRNTKDFKSAPYYVLKKGEKFGPTEW
ncbi:OPT superfamily oligopeptide transporter [Suhomyces tanzawaensis NRRL Y-17324]|uniref:OPT superfamily oligopeptide transporter n=1 Tax=Suhomyces tanzawaensis NRRL Y-17324 TaxID=984487 RepID=A0A1E4SNB8_9ASCO|nr:OPT superfamily oligopeptide transporter [Suhomyces tanzawaensis NRRL Y-17324]ODV80917.1 OPT superfamily oligopeptide transporter [Suhomyces tanzawaensis NRRL Y-17324]